jgi:hypothetical protein
MVLNDFEGEADALSTYKGPSSNVTVELSTAQAHSGKQSVFVKTDCKDWTGAVYSLADGQNDWTGLSTLKMWVYGSNSGNKFNVILEDKSGEQHTTQLMDSFSGWKEISIALARFKARTDYQPGTADKNGNLDMPLKTVQFCVGIGGTYDLYFDDFSVE